MTPILLIEALGAIVQIDLEGLSEDDADAVREAWRDALAADTPPEPTGPVVTPITADRTQMLSELSQQVTLAALEQRRGELWMLHAAGLAGADGRVVVLVGPSGRGKTTAVRTLAASFGYVSDESVAIDDDGHVWPYRKPLSVIEDSGKPKAQRSPSELGLGALPDAALRVAAIVLLDRDERALEHPVIEDVDLGEALGDLVSQSSYLTSMPAPLHSIAALATATGGIRRVRYREAASLLPVIESLLANPTPLIEPAHLPVAERAKRGETPTPEITASPRYSRTPVVDALDLTGPDRIAILRSAPNGTGALRVLGGVAPAVWRVADAASVSELTAAAIAVYGQPDADPTAMVQAAADELVGAGVLSTDRWWRIRHDVAWVDRDGRAVALRSRTPSAPRRRSKGRRPSSGRRSVSATGGRRMPSSTRSSPMRAPIGPTSPPMSWRSSSRFVR